MPTAKPRVNLTLSHEANAVLAELASLRDVSKASIVVELIEAAEPVLQRTLVILRALSAMKERAGVVTEETLSDFVKNMDDAERVLAPLLADSLGVFESLVDALPDDTQPPHSNTGVTSQFNVNSSGRSSTEKEGHFKHLQEESHGSRQGGSEK